MAPPPAEPPRDGASAACLLSSPLLHLPLPCCRPPHLGRVAHAPQNAALLAAAAHRLVRTLVAAASQHPFVRPLISLHSHLQNLSEVRCGERRVARSLSAHGFAAILPGDSVAVLVVANGVTNFLNIYNSLLVVRLVLTWFPNSPPAIVSPLSTLCDPYLNIFRGIIPPLGGTLDLSPILAFLVLNAFTSTAAALPAELPVTMASKQDISSSHPMSLGLTTSQEKWMRRVFCKRSKDSEDVK